MYRRIIVEPTTRCQCQCAICPVYKPVDSVKIPFHELKINQATKIAKYCSRKLKSSNVTFGNWSEPFLNKNIIEIINKFRKYNFKVVVVNSNFSLDLDIDKIVREDNINRINVSMSGLTNSVYNVYHRMGNIDVILSNISELLKLKKRYDSKINVVVKWHRFIHNEKELKDAEEYFESKDVKFTPYYAHMGCIENIRDYMTDQNNMEKNTFEFINDRVHNDFLIEKCEYSPEAKKCQQRKFLTIHSDGHILHCCALYSSYLYRSEKRIYEMTPKEIKKFKSTRLEFCKTCLELGISKYFNNPKVEENQIG